MRCGSLGIISTPDTRTYHRHVHTPPPGTLRSKAAAYRGYVNSGVITTSGWQKGRAELLLHRSSLDIYPIPHSLTVPLLYFLPPNVHWRRNWRFIFLSKISTALTYLSFQAYLVQQRWECLGFLRIMLSRLQSPLYCIIHLQTTLESRTRDFENRINRCMTYFKPHCTWSKSLDILHGSFFWGWIFGMKPLTSLKTKDNVTCVLISEREILWYESR